MGPPAVDLPLFMDPHRSPGVPWVPLGPHGPIGPTGRFVEGEYSSPMGAIRSFMADSEADLEAPLRLAKPRLGKGQVKARPPGAVPAAQGWHLTLASGYSLLATALKGQSGE